MPVLSDLPVYAPTALPATQAAQTVILLAAQAEVAQRVEHYLEGRGFEVQLYDL